MSAHSAPCSSASRRLARRAGAALVCLALGSAAAVAAAAERAGGPAARPAQAPAADQREARVIVRFREPAAALAASTRESAQALQARRASQARELGLRFGVALEAGRALSVNTQALRARGIDAASLARHLAEQPEVAYAVPDQRRRAFAAPNDPLYTSGPAATGPASGQWYLRAPSTESPSSIDAEGAWALQRGSAATVVAVLDTGVRFDHGDLLRTTAGGKLLPGYDMVDDVEIANDGDGRDADPSDPGDWLTLTEVLTPNGTFEGCADGAVPSSWHGTLTASLVGALTGNGIGMAGSAPGVTLLPVRVLGKCGGFDSDIIDGMRWAAGLQVPGLPLNPNPAKVLNLSLGGTGACSAAYLDVMRELDALGVVVVAAAGNTTGHAVGTPANCPGVIGVTGLRHVGTKVGFSDLGPEISIAAPGGNCVNIDEGSPCLYPILGATNAGTTTPVANSTVFTDAYNISVGTSFAAPLVAGTAALMLAARPTLEPDELLQRMKATARPFPTTGGDNGDGTVVPQCTAPQLDANGDPVDQLQCYCTTATCGAGMLDARAAVASVLSLVPSIAVSPAAPVAGTPVVFDASGSTVPSGRSIAAYRWSIVQGGGIVSAFVGATDGTRATLTPSGAGSFTVGLALTDDLGDTTTTTQAVTVTAAAGGGGSGGENGGGGGGGGGGGAFDPAWGLGLALAVIGLRRLRRYPGGA